MATSNNKPVSWVTIRGAKVPVYKGDSKEDIVSRVHAKKSSGFRAQSKVDKLNNMKSRSKK